MNRNATTFACMVLSCAAAVAQQPETPHLDVGQRLDQPLATVTIRGMEIENVLAELGKHADVEIALDEDAVELLPWGKQTKLADVTITNASLRSALPQILETLGMTYEVRENKVFVVPTEPLKRLKRRPTWDELKVLRTLAAADYSPENFGGLKIQYQITSKVDAKAMLQHQLERSGRGTVGEMLETATSALNWVWFVESDHIVIRAKETQIGNNLSRQVSAKYTNMPLSQILADLGDKADVVISFDPGMMLKLPPSTAQSYTLLLQSVSIRQGLELICAETGLKYEIRTDGVHMSLSDAATADGSKAAVPPRNSPYVAKLSVPSADGSYTLDFLVRADELPADIMEARGQMLQELIQKVRKEIAPAPQPAPAQSPSNR